MEGGGTAASQLSVLTDVHLLLRNGVLEEQGQQTGSEVNVRFPMPGTATIGTLEGYCWSNPNADH